MIDIRFTVHTVGKTPRQTLRDYISVRYDRWLDYSKYKCSLQKMDEFAVDLLDEVLLNLLQRDEQLLLKLYNKKKVHKGKEYTELDFFILRAIELNSISDNAPFRWKNKPIPTNREVKLERLNIIDEEYTETDRPAEILKQTKLIRWVFNGLKLTVFERYVFERKFFMGESLQEIEWHADNKNKYSIYNDVLTVIHNILYYYCFSYLTPKKELTNRQLEIVEQFIRTHKIRTLKSK